MKIDSVQALRSLYDAPVERAVKKQIAYLDRHCRQFIELSPFVVLSSGDAQRGLDASPRGGTPGFVKIVDEKTLLIPDASGNNRLDTLENIIANGQLGLLFMIPGIDETLRVNGVAQLSTDAAYLDRFVDERRSPKLVIKLDVTQAYIHCAKAFMRSRLWRAESQIDRSVLATMRQIINDQTGDDLPPESQAEMARRYEQEL